MKISTPISFYYDPPILRIFQKIQPPQFNFHPAIICKMNSILCSGKVFMIKSVSKMLITHLNFTYIRGELRIVNENGTVPMLSIGQRCINIGPWPMTFTATTKITTIATCFHMINPLNLLSCYLQVTIEKNIRIIWKKFLSSKENSSRGKH